MRRRKFFQVASLSVAGLSMATSCTNAGKTTGPGPEKGQHPKKVPNYRENIKSSFTKGKTKSANDTLILALIGAGSYGTSLILEAAGLGENISVKYVCDVDDTRGGRAISELEKIQGSKPVRVRDMRKVLDDPEIDGVFIATPEHWHALATVWACQAGKDVYVEKCISHSIGEGQKMIEAAMKYERIVQCGTQNRSADYAYTAREYIKSGGLGDIAAVHVRELLNGPVPFNEKENSRAPDTIDWDLWLGPAPKVPYNVSRNKSWGYYWDYSGGYVLTGGSIHQLDMARLVLGDPGLPKSVYSTGGRYFFDDNRDMPDYQMTTFDFGTFVMTLETGACTPYMVKSSPRIRFGDDFPEWKQNATRIEIFGTKRMMYVGRMGGGWQVYDKGGEIVARESGIYPRKAHIKNYLDCIRTRKQPNGNIVQGHKSSVMAHLANISYRSGCNQLVFSPKYESIESNNKAQELAQLKYRKGFEIPDEV
ncbi:Myo-inositol 2-dehydrogenase [hydrothermal vent metagenome]|uniref:Myo-inositol 2-dehydrogenase n=1 Tax=hydrothermal vent metagenome TaxID=652676 RepID=A0A3B0TW35_9ZZZZ